MALTKKDKELIIDIIENEIHERHNVYDLKLLHRLKIKLEGSKLTKVYNVDFIYNQVKDYFPEGMIDVSHKKELIKLIDIDMKEPGEIINVIIWARTDRFWSTVFLSIKKLRKKDKEKIMYYDKFCYLMKNENKQTNKDGATNKELAEMLSSKYASNR